MKKSRFTEEEAKVLEMLKWLRSLSDDEKKQMRTDYLERCGNPQPGDGDEDPFIYPIK